ncbi:MAG: MoxR-like ATPase [Verrucomicrobiales bacterium]|jgi:MoxR-like ATPase
MSHEPPTDSEATEAAKHLKSLRETLQQVLFGQDELIDLVITGMLANGHLLLEGLPGLGKTELVKGLASALGLHHRRVQFTPDLLPGDITGTPLLEHVDGSPTYRFQKGPVFTQLLLADEINRASPKTQSALLEALQERHVTVLGETHPLPKPFFVLATQNPIELEGTYPLPEAQLDRFLFKLEVLRTDAATLEKIVMKRDAGVPPEISQVFPEETLNSLLALTRRIHLPDVVANFIARLVDSTHPGVSKASSKHVRYGASPRAALGLASGCRARALLSGRIHASFEDVRALALPVLQHRIHLDYSARVEGLTTRQLVTQLLEEVTDHADATPASLTA